MRPRKQSRLFYCARYNESVITSHIIEYDLTGPTKTFRSLPALIAPATDKEPGQVHSEEHEIFRARVAGQIHTMPEERAQLLKLVIEIANYEKQPRMPSHSSDQSRPVDHTSVSLLQRARMRNPAAWEQLVWIYTPMAARWCHSFAGRLQDADLRDILQDVFLAVANGIESFRREHPGDSFRKWLKSITRFKVVDWARRRDREQVGRGGSSAQH